MSNHSHRSGWLKQKNKQHKSFQNKLTKGALKRQNLGKVDNVEKIGVKKQSANAFLQGRKVKNKIIFKRKLLSNFRIKLKCISLMIINFCKFVTGK